MTERCLQRLNKGGNDNTVPGVTGGLTNLNLANRPLPVFTCPSMPEPINPVYACYSSYGWSRGSYDVHTPRQTSDLGGDTTGGAVDEWKGKYNDPPNSPWKVTVENGTNDLPPFQID